jgi:hypothetical protein
VTDIQVCPVAAVHEHPVVAVTVTDPVPPETPKLALAGLIEYAQT